MNCCIAKLQYLIFIFMRCSGCIWICLLPEESEDPITLLKAVSKAIPWSESETLHNNYRFSSGQDPPLCSWIPAAPPDEGFTGHTRHWSDTVRISTADYTRQVVWPVSGCKATGRKGREISMQREVWLRAKGVSMRLRTLWRRTRGVKEGEGMGRE